MITLVKKTNPKDHVSFMPHAFNQSEHPFGQCEHFSQIEPFEKSWFFVINFDIVWYLDFSTSKHVIRD